MKNKYKKAEVVIVKFTNDDVICASNELPIRPFEIDN